MMPAHKINSYLANPALEKLTDKALQLIALQHLWDKLAAPTLSKNCRIGNLQNKTIIIYADNGAIAAKLKQSLPSLLEQFQKRGIQVTAIQVIVQAKKLFEASKPGKSIELTEQSISSLKQLEQSLAPSSLKDSLQKMVKRHS